MQRSEVDKADCRSQFTDTIPLLGREEDTSDSNSNDQSNVTSIPQARLQQGSYVGQALSKAFSGKPKPTLQANESTGSGQETDAEAEQFQQELARRLSHEQAKALRREQAARLQKAGMA